MSNDDYDFANLSRQKIVENFDYEKGMTTSIQAGIRAAQNTH